ncbi:Uncharacterised protein [Brucella anthropi]|nr:Uncharacterised protein [Brucella anthropi]
MSCCLVAADVGVSVGCLALEYFTVQRASPILLRKLGGLVLPGFRGLACLDCFLFILAVVLALVPG